MISPGKFDGIFISVFINQARGIELRICIMCLQNMEAFTAQAIGKGVLGVFCRVPKCKFTPRLHHIGLFRGPKLKFPVWACHIDGA